MTKLKRRGLRGQTIHIKTEGNIEEIEWDLEPKSWWGTAVETAEKESLHPAPKRYGRFEAKMVKEK